MQNIHSVVCSVFLLFEYVFQLCPTHEAGVCHFFVYSADFRTFGEEFTTVMTSYMPGFLFFLFQESGHLRRNRKNPGSRHSSHVNSSLSPGNKNTDMESICQCCKHSQRTNLKLRLPPTSPEVNLTYMKLEAWINRLVTKKTLIEKKMNSYCTRLKFRPCIYWVICPCEKEEIRQCGLIQENVLLCFTNA